MQLRAGSLWIGRKTVFASKVSTPPHPDPLPPGEREFALRPKLVFRPKLLLRRMLVGFLMGCLFISSLGAALSAAAERRPNIVFFMVDDMGWMDTTVNGSRYYETPNMERLAERGMVFTDAYTANPLCSPTRASIMTGKYPARLRITTPAGHLKPLPDEPLIPKEGPPNQKMLIPRSKRFLPVEEYTIAEALRDSGYRTAHMGKWHLGLNPEHWPEAQGFEVSFHGAPDPGPRSYFSPYQFPAGTVTDGPEGEYITDRLTGEAVRFIEANRDRPFFLNLWQYGVHGPWGHKEEITKRFAEKKDPRGKQGNPIMASMLKSVDESLGGVMDKLDELGLTEKTVFIFFSDNGGNIHSNTKEDTKTVPKNSRRWPMIQDWRRWAGYLGPTNNEPLRGGKAMIYEGGSRVPMIVAWPGVVKPGSRCSEVISSVDFYPTLLEIAGLEPKPGQVLDGESILPMLEQSGKLNREAIFCHFPHGLGRLNAPATYVRKGPWKLIRFFVPNEYFPNEYELYNLEDDLGETNNLADAMPEKVRELDRLIDRFLDQTDALVPVPNPKYDPQAAAMGRWVVRGSEFAVRDGCLHLEPTGRSPFVATASLKIPGPVVATVRMKAPAGGAGKIQWRTAGQETFPTTGQIVSFDVPPGDEWREVRVEVPVQGTLAHVRLYPPPADKIEIDWIRFSGASETVVEQVDFEPAE
jgi:arylsulfatase A-like enzyme